MGVNQMSISKILLVFVATSLMGSAALGDNGSPLQGLKRPPVQTLKTKKVAFVVGNGSGSALAGGTFTIIDSPTTFSCTKACTISADSMVQYQPGASGVQWAICIYVDGSSIGCPYQSQAANTFFQVGNVQEAASLAIGNHTVQTQVFVSSASSLYGYTLAYQLNQ